MSEALYLVKLPHLNLAYSANKFKEITVPAYIEATLNIVISVALVKKLGLIGVTIGTIVGMTYRMVFHVYYTSKIVPGRAQRIFYQKLFLFAVGAGAGFALCYKLLPLQNVTVGSWIVHAIFYCVVIGSILLAISVLFFQNEILREIYKEVRGAYDEYSSDFCRWCRQPDAQQGATQAVSGNVQQAVQQVKK